MQILGCKTDQESLQVYDAEVHEGKYEAVSMPGQVIGKCFEYRKLLEWQTSSQICPKTPNRAGSESCVSLLLSGWNFSSKTICMENERKI